MSYIKFIVIIIITACLLSCTPEKEVVPSNELEVSKLDGSLSGSLNHLFKIDLDSLRNIENEVTDIYGEKYKLRYQKNRSGMTNDYYLWGSFLSKSDHSYLTRGRRAVRREDKSFFWEYFLEFVPDSQKYAFSSINPDNLECHFLYQRPFRAASTLPFVGWLMHDEASNTYFYGEAIGQYVKIPEEGFCDTLHISRISFLLDKKIIIFEEKRSKIPFTGEYSYLVFRTKEDIISEIEKLEDFNITTDLKKIANIFDWLNIVQKIELDTKQFRDKNIKELYYNYSDSRKTSDGFNKSFGFRWLAHDKNSDTYYYGECFNSDASGKNKSKYIYNPLE